MKDSIQSPLIRTWRSSIIWNSFGDVDLTEWEVTPEVVSPTKGVVAPDFAILDAEDAVLEATNGGTVVPTASDDGYRVVTFAPPLNPVVVLTTLNTSKMLYFCYYVSSIYLRDE